MPAKDDGSADPGHRSDPAAGLARRDVHRDFLSGADLEDGARRRRDEALDLGRRFDSTPAWSADSKRIAYFGDSELRVMDAETGASIVLPTQLNGAEELYFRPDGGSAFCVVIRRAVHEVPFLEQRRLPSIHALRYMGSERGADCQFTGKRTGQSPVPHVLWHQRRP